MDGSLLAHWQGLRKEGLVIPLGVMGFWTAALVGVHRDTQLATQLVFGFQALVPLVAGILAAGLVVGDPALELLLSLVSSPFRFLVGRLAALLATVYAATLAFEGLALALGALPARPPGSWGWVPPWLAAGWFLSTLGTLAGLATGTRIGGALLPALVWLLALTNQGPWRLWTWSQCFNPLLAFRPPAGAPLGTNLMALALLGAGLLLASYPWIRRPERYL